MLGESSLLVLSTSAASIALSSIPTDSRIRRARTIPTARFLSTLLASSTITSTTLMPTVPTGAYDRRTRTSPPTLVLLTLLAASATTVAATVSIVPTGAFIFAENGCYTNVVYLVYLDGDVYTGHDDGVYGSYGI